MRKHQTLVILADGLPVHPRSVTIDGKEYAVVTSADGHLAAKCDVLQELVDTVALGNTDADELQNQALLAIYNARIANMGGYHD